MTIGRHAGGDRLRRHAHAGGYVALVLAGGYVEAGDGGRWRVEAGQAVVHDDYSAHQDVFLAAGATVLNLPPVAGLAAGVTTVADPDLIVRLAARDPRAAALALAEGAEPGGSALADWPDLLADRLTGGSQTPLCAWADAMRLDPASISRGFARVYGVTPKRFRLEARTRRAVRALPGWRGSLATLAAEHGFADQPHLTRSVLALTGKTPSALRAKCVQAEVCAIG